MFHSVKVKGISALLVLKFATFPYIIFICIWLWSSSIHRNVQFDDGQPRLTIGCMSRQMPSINKGQLNDTRTGLGCSGTKRALASTDVQQKIRHGLFNDRLNSQSVYTPKEAETLINTTLVSVLKKTDKGVTVLLNKTKGIRKGYKKVNGKLIYSWLSEKIEKNFDQTNVGLLHVDKTLSHFPGLMMKQAKRVSFNANTIVQQSQHQQQISKEALLINKSSAQLLTIDQLKSDGLINLGTSKQWKTKASTKNPNTYNYKWHRGTNSSIKTAVKNGVTQEKPNQFTNFLDFLSVNSIATHEINRLNLRTFQAILTKHEIRIFQELLSKFSQIVEGKKLPYFLYSGSLLGSYRHHGMIPWDDDIDVMMNSSHKNQIKEAFANVYPQYQLYSGTRFRWKFYSSLSQPIKRFPWAWPFIDISFYEENATHIWDQDPIFSNSFCFERSTTFPLTLRPFCHTMHPAPKNTVRFLSKTYNVEICQTTVYSHKTERSINYPPPLKILCSDLTGIIPLVKRKTSATGLNETLLIGNKTISQVFIVNN